jgi:hypothetical protein
MKNKTKSYGETLREWIPCTEFGTPLKDKRQFDSGAIRDNDTNKPDFIETISWTAFRKFGEYMTSKKQKYGAGNFKKGIPIESYEQSLVRHLQKYLENKYEDGQQEREEDHLSAMVFNLFGILHEQGRNEKKS